MLQVGHPQVFRAQKQLSLGYCDSSPSQTQCQTEGAPLHPDYHFEVLNSQGVTSQDTETGYTPTIILDGDEYYPPGLYNNYIGL